MDVLFQSFTVRDRGIYAQAVCGKTSAEVWVEPDSVRVICRNASHRVWRGFGRLFPSMPEALDGYKKPEMKAILRAVNLRNS